MKLPLAVPDYGRQEILETLDSLLSTEVTMGKKVRRFEEMWAAHVGRKYAVAVNSGSSANLLAVDWMVSWLETQHEMVPFETEVIVPAVTWSTTAAPYLQHNFKVVFADIDETLCLDPTSAQEAASYKTKAIAVVPLLGNVYDSKVLAVGDNPLLVHIDACEGHGAKLGPFDAGAFGDIATWSFFLSHHVSTVEGGMIATDNLDVADFLRSARAHGWIRERSDRDAVAAAHPNIDPRFFFLTLGYNVRMTELAAAFGLHQVAKLEEIVDHRRKVAHAWSEYLAAYKEWFILPVERPNTRHSYFGYPLIIRPGAPFDRQEVTAFLNGVEIDTRPIMAHLQKHPAYAGANYRSVPTPMADLVHTNGFFVGLHKGIGPEEQQYFIDMMHMFLREQ